MLTGEQLLDCIGSYWNVLFRETRIVRGHMDGFAESYLQAMQNFVEAAQAVSRQEIPVFHRERWHPLQVRRSQLTTVPEHFLTYGIPGTTFGSGLNFGQPTVTGRFVLPLPSRMVDVQKIHNRILQPSLTLHRDTGFEVRDGFIRLDLDLFDSPLVPHREIVDEQGLSIDVEILLWAQDADFDHDYVWQHFGSVLGIFGSSSEDYKAIINTVWDNRVAGSNLAAVRSLISLLAGIPLIVEAQETVQGITQQANGTSIVTTDQRNYVIAAPAAVSVNVGQTLLAGDSVTDALQIVELHGAHRTLPEWVKSLPAGEGVFVNGPLISFPNRTVATYVAQVDGEGRLDFRFPLDGPPPHVQHYWQTLHASGLAAGRTVANTLDQRTNRIGEPTVSDLPTALNPAQMLIEQLIGMHLLLARVQVTGLINVELMQYATLLRSMLPPHVCCFLFFEAHSGPEYYAADDIADDAGLTIGPAAQADTYAASDILEQVSVRTVGGHC